MSGMNRVAYDANLTPQQKDTIAVFQQLGVPATWFIGDVDDDGEVEVIALGEKFIWSLRIEPDGDHSVSEATVGEFTTGISV